MPNPNPNRKYLGFPFTIDARIMMQRAFDYMATKIPGWQPSEGQPDVWLIEAVMGEAADIGSLVSQVPKSVFRYLGTIYGILPLNASAASVETTWTLTDTLGHTISAGTQVAIADAAGTLQPFTVLVDVIVPTGQSVTTAGQVLCIATFPGAAAEALGSPAGAVQLLDTIPWVSSITQVAASAGGSDGETDDEYLDRLATELQTITPTPVLPDDFAILARNVAGVQRAVAVDGYNPADNTFNNEKMVTVVALDEAGAGVGVPIRTAIEDYLEGLRLNNFVVNTMDPTSTAVDVTTTYTVKPGFVPADADAFVTQTIDDFLDSTIWGIVAQGDDPTNPRTWNNETTVRYLELATAINNTPGVDVITLLTIGVASGTQASQDLVLSGVVPIPSAGTISVVGTA